jgi:viroplasmin and RNaseH domain-containing protein
MGRGSYIGGSTTINVYGRFSKPNPKKRRLGGRTKHIPKQDIEHLLDKIIYHSKVNDTDSMYKYAINICQKLSGQRKTEKNQRYIKGTFSKLHELGINMDILKIKIKESFKKRLEKRLNKKV